MATVDAVTRALFSTHDTVFRLLQAKVVLETFTNVQGSSPRRQARLCDHNVLASALPNGRRLSETYHMHTA